MSERPDVQVTDNPDAGRYDAHVNGELAGYLVYREEEGGIILVHTEVFDAFEGGRLVSTALDEIRERGLSVTPLCRFAAGYIDKHPEYADLIAA